MALLNLTEAHRESENGYSPIFRRDGVQPAPGGGAESARDRASCLLAALVAHDAQTAEHSRESAALARQVGMELDLGPKDLDELQTAALLHDIGKVLIPAETLNKPEPLDASEWSLIKRHPLLGANLLGGVPALEGVARAVLQHHERPDGLGYPNGLHGTEITTAGSIIATCDAYQAMTSSRPYQPSRSTSRALDEIERCAGTQFREDAAEALVAVVGAAPTRARSLRAAGGDRSLLGRLLVAVCV